MFRVLGVLLIFSACTLTGIGMSLNIRKKAERISLERKMILDMITLIRYKALTLSELLDELSGNSQYNGFQFLQIDCKSRRCPFSEIWSEAVKKDDVLSDEEKNVLISLGYELGTTDTEGQISALEVYAARLEEMYDSEQKKYAAKGKMYRSLGAIFGAMAGILIL